MKKKILVLYKTHLDIGFTDLSERIVQLYLTNYIPKAINTAIELNSENEKAFVWQTGSWIIDKYLKSVSGEELRRAEYAIKKDYISWHAMPFTAHTELFTPELLDYALGISKELDKKYGKKTVAAKATDVPGMTKAMIKPLVNAGVKFLHTGVNPASTLPRVPSAFLWRNNDGEEITVVYNGEYGEYTEISDNCAVIFKFAGDNCAPMNADMVTRGISELREKFPDYEIVPATLNDVAYEIEKIRDTLPVVTSEIGDSWIHGVMTDPRKVFSYQALLSYAKTIPEQEREEMYEHLLMVPEHTWGLDEKTTLKDHENYAKDDFYSVLGNDNFRRFESSWDEQRGYVDSALKAAKSDGAAMLVSEYRREKLALEDSGKDLPNDLKINGYGEIISLTVGEKILADEDHPLCAFLYEQFSENEYDRFFSRYNRKVRAGETPHLWMIEDFTKPGMSSGVDKYYSYRPVLKKVAFDGEKVLVDCDMPSEACERFGAPRSLQYLLSFEKDGVLIDFAWFDKDKNRMAEAMWLSFSPLGTDKTSWKIEKIGQMIDPLDHVELGGMQNYTSGKITNSGIEFDFPDGALVTFGKPNLLTFDDLMVNGEMISLNLYNNKWGTNFPMWYGEDGRIRMKISLSY